MSDIVEALRQDHRSIEHLLNRFESLGSEDRSEWFDQLRQVVVRHEGAEERTVYPAVRDAVSEEPIASHKHTASHEPAVPHKHTASQEHSVFQNQALDDRLAEQAEAHDLIARLEIVKSETEEFRKGFLRLRRAVLDHVEQEERTLIRSIEQSKSLEERHEMGRQYERAKHGAPRPTPQAAR